jgi:hypothetical protein
MCFDRLKQCWKEEEEEERKRKVKMEYCEVGRKKNVSKVVNGCEV